MYQKPTVPRSIGGVLDDSIQLFKASFSKAWLPAVLSALVVIGVAAYQLTHIPHNAPVASTFQRAFAQSFAASGATNWLSILGWLVDVVFYGIVIYNIAAVANGTASSGGTNFAAPLRRTLPLIGATLIVIVLWCIGIVIVLIPLFFAFGRVGGGGLAAFAAASGPAVLVCLVLLIPVIYVLSRMMLFMVPLVSESQGPLASIGTSWRLVGGNWWRSTTTIFVMGVILYITLIVLVAISGVIAALVSVGTTASANSAAHVAGTVALFGVVMAGAMRIVATPLLCAVYVAIFNDLRLRKGGADLQARLGALPQG